MTTGAASILACEAGSSGLTKKPDEHLCGELTDNNVHHAGGTGVGKQDACAPVEDHAGGTGVGKQDACAPVEDHAGGTGVGKQDARAPVEDPPEEPALASRMLALQSNSKPPLSSRDFCANICDMWSKIYLAILGLSILVMAFFSYYSWSWLQSIGQPAAAAAGYEYHAGLAWPLLWITTILLLLLGNAVLWTTKRSWAMWVTFVFFAAMAVLRFFRLEQAYFRFRKDNFFDGSFALGPFVAVLMIAVMAAIVFFNQFILVRLYRKMYPQIDDVVVETAESVPPA